MVTKEEVIAKLDQLSPENLERVNQYVVSLATELPPKRIKNDAYLRVQEAFKGVKGSMSQLIIDERADRV